MNPLALSPEILARAEKIRETWDRARELRRMVERPKKVETQVIRVDEWEEVLMEERR